MFWKKNNTVDEEIRPAAAPPIDANPPLKLETATLAMG